MAKNARRARTKNTDDGFPLEVDDNSKWVCAARSA
jgi:hypothetical protein